MEKDQLRDYLERLELEVLVPGALAGRFGKVMPIPVRNGRLAKTAFSQWVGRRVPSEESIAIDYYGLLKKSKGMVEEISQVRQENLGKQLKLIDGLVVHFAALRIEDVARMTPELVADFPFCKEKLLELRGFRKGNDNG